MNDQMEAKKDHFKTPQPASTVILIRPNAGGFQVYLLKRNVRSGFMPGYYVFPGGRLDPEDQDTPVWKAHVDLGSKEIISRLGGDLKLEKILAYGVAAIRETFEEAGVLFAYRKGQPEENLERIIEIRLNEKVSRGWFKHLVVSEGWTLALSSLFRWAHWITPERMKRRFDTRFFMAFLSPEQVCRPDRRETTHGIWISPKEGLAGNMAAKVPLSPPTLVTLHELSKYKSYEEMVNEAENRLWAEARQPRLVLIDKETIILQPWDRKFRQKEVRIETEQLENTVLPIEEPFSRIWRHKGIWRAIKA